VVRWPDTQLRSELETMNLGRGVFSSRLMTPGRGSCLRMLK